MAASEPEFDNKMTYSSSIKLGSLPTDSKQLENVMEEKEEGSKKEEDQLDEEDEEEEDKGVTNDSETDSHISFEIDSASDLLIPNADSLNSDDEIDSASDSQSQHAYSRYMSHMITDSEEDFKDMARTLRHYKRKRRRRRRGSSASRSINSNCSCSSCASDTNHAFFGKQVGPPGGEMTYYRRFTIWLESIKYMMGLFVFGMLLVSAMFAIASVWAYYREKPEDHEAGKGMFKWTMPLLVLSVLMLIGWRLTWHILIMKGYGQGDQVECRRSIITFAQRKELAYTVRGAIYAPVKLNPKYPKENHEYAVVGYESEYDSQGYFDSDLEPDGQYKKDITPWKDAQDPVIRDKRNIYTRKAWFRDVPIVWWELWNQPIRDF